MSLRVLLALIVIASANAADHPTDKTVKAAKKNIIEDASEFQKNTTRAVQRRLQAVTYTDLGWGKCLSNGQDPTHTYHDRQGSVCQQMCSDSSCCYGYSVSGLNNCLLWTQSGLSGGGAGWGGAHCHVKSQVCKCNEKYDTNDHPASQQFGGSCEDWDSEIKNSESQWCFVNEGVCAVEAPSTSKYNSEPLFWSELPCSLSKACSSDSDGSDGGGNGGESGDVGVGVVVAIIIAIGVAGIICVLLIRWYMRRRPRADPVSAVVAAVQVPPAPVVVVVVESNAGLESNEPNPNTEYNAPVGSNESNPNKEYSNQ